MFHRNDFMIILVKICHSLLNILLNNYNYKLL